MNGNYLTNGETKKQKPTVLQSFLDAEQHFEFLFWVSNVSLGDYLRIELLICQTQKFTEFHDKLQTHLSAKFPLRLIFYAKFYSFNWFYGTNIIKSIWGKASIKEYGHCFLESKLIKNRPLLLSPVSHFKWVFNSLYLFIIFVFIPICRKWTPSHGFRFYFSFTGWKDRCEFLLSGQKIDKLT